MFVVAFSLNNRSYVITFSHVHPRSKEEIKATYRMTENSGEVKTLVIRSFQSFGKENCAMFAIA